MNLAAVLLTLDELPRTAQVVSTLVKINNNKRGHNAYTN